MIRARQPTAPAINFASTAASLMSARFEAVNNVTMPSSASADVPVSLPVPVAEFGRVAGGELFELGRVVLVPLAQLGGRRHLFARFIQMGPHLADPSRPEPVDQRPLNRRVGSGVLVDPAELYVPWFVCHAAPFHCDTRGLVWPPYRRRSPRGCDLARLLHDRPCTRQAVAVTTLNPAWDRPESISAHRLAMISPLARDPKATLSLDGPWSFTLYDRPGGSPEPSPPWRCPGAGRCRT